MPTVRVMPPPTGVNSHTVNGRTYSAAPGSFLDVPDFDAAVLTSNGWSAIAGGVGGTTSRPANPSKGDSFLDTTLGYTIHFDGKNWRSKTTGAIV